MNWIKRWFLQGRRITITELERSLANKTEQLRTAEESGLRYWIDGNNLREDLRKANGEIKRLEIEKEVLLRAIPSVTAEAIKRLGGAER